MFAAKGGFLGTTAPVEVLFDTVGSIVALGTGTSFSTNLSPTAGAYVLAGITVANTALPTSVQFGGVAMTALGDIALNNSGANGRLSLWGLDGVAGGSAACTGNKAANSGAMNLISFKNVGSVINLATVFGAAGAASQSPTCTLGQRIVQMFAEQGTMTGLSGGTNRAAGARLVVNDSAGSATFAGTASSVWAGISAVLVPG